MNVSLSDIEKAVTKNFVLKKEPCQRLEEEESSDKSGSTQIAQIVFVGIAHERGHSMEDICVHMDQTEKEYSRRLQRFREMYRDGKRHLLELKKEGIPIHLLLDKRDVHLGAVKVYRKTVLVNNCLELILQDKRFELRKSLPNYVR